MTKPLHVGSFVRKLPFLSLLLLLLLYAGSLNAQTSYVSSYVFTPTIPGPYIPISSGTILGTGTVDDDTYTGLNIGFPFVYDNIVYTTFSVNANGYVRLGNNMNGNRSPVSDQIENVLAAFTEDLEGTNSGEIRYDTLGVAPNRKLVIQFKDWGFYNRNGDDSLDFQIVLHESTNAIDFIYGRFFKTGEDYVQVGITGNDGSQYICRTTNEDWNETTSGSQYDYCFLSDEGPIVPYSGLVYTFTPPAITYITSTVDAGPAIGVAAGSTDQIMGRIKITTDGIGSYLPLTSITVNTTGTTSLASVSNVKVYYTGASPYFNNNTQFGATTFSPVLTNIITDSVNLLSGDNYFWVTYDIAPGAVLGQVMDASVPSLVVGNVTQTPAVTSPAGNRVVSTPMSYISSTATQNLTGKVARGTENNQILGLTVITSATGAPRNITQIDFDANGTTDTSNIYNIKVWYTGSSDKFATGSQFGATIAHLPGSNYFSVMGSQALTNDTNYFWLTYDIVDTAALTNLVDASCNSLLIGGVFQVPVVTAPIGAREIRTNYCPAVVSNAANSCSNGYYISAVVTSGAENDLSNYSGCNGNANNYINYADKVLTVKQNQNISIELGDYSSWITYGVWIDYNQDGVFDNITELVFQGSTTGNEGYVNGNFTIPCNALPGTTRMRIRGGDYWWFAAPINDPCSDIGYGETEDYTVEILNNPITLSSFEPEQLTGIAAPGTTDKVILEIPVTTDGCGVAVNTNMRFSTTGTTNTANLLNAKLYRTPKATFNTSNLIGTATSPNGQFSFTLSDTLETAGTTFYWLTYDISSSATLLNTIDARFDSMETLGGYHKPATGSPAGNIQVFAPMTYVGSSALQPVTTKVGRGTEDNEILCVRVVTSATGAAVKLTDLSFDAAGTTDTANISNMKVWYTGSKNTFATDNQFGSTLSYLPGVLNFTITGEQTLLNDTNYFWLTYDIDDSSTLTNLVDASCNALTIAGVMQTPTVTSPTGTREIRQDYCTAIISNASNACNWGYYISAVSTSGATGDLSVYSGCNGNNNNYVYNTSDVLTVKQNENIQIDLGDYSSYITYAVWIDYNQDGIFNNTNERIFQGPTTQNSGFVSGNFTIPCDALPGTTRMRIRGGDYYWFSAPISSACTDIGVGETEDYNIVILPNPITVSSLEPEQLAGVVPPGTTDKVIFKIPFVSEGCGVLVNTDMKFSTTGTTTAANILSAKLYRTSTASFNTSTLLGSVPSPSGQFTFFLTDTLVPSGTTYYWLAYDISSSAAISNIIDARFDSVQISGTYHKPLTGNPSGNLQIMAPMSFISATTTQNNQQKVAKGSSRSEVLGVQVIGSSTGAPINVTDLSFSANGTTDTSEIENINVWYTGNNSNFATINQFGTTLSQLTGSYLFTVNGIQQLANDTNYFWLTYDVKSGAVSGHLIDGECTGLTVGAVPQVTLTSAPSGGRLIKNPSCSPAPGGNPNITNVTLGSMDFDPPFNPGPSYYKIFPPTVATTTLYKSDIMTISVNTNDDAVINAWIDFDDDGLFSPSEMIPITMSTGGAGNAASTTFQVPCTSVTGAVSMRVMSRFTGNPNTDPCRTGGSGEAHDYTVTIMDNPAAFDYTTAIQQTEATSVGVLNKPILKVPVQAKGCGVAVTTQLRFSTTGTTSTSDIVNATLYKTGASDVFSTATPVGVVPSPNGQFSFTLTDTLVPNEPTNYWLTYDISSSAVLTHVVDARLDSVEVMGAFHTPIAGNPSGNILITSPMSYISSTVTQNMVQKVGRGEENNEVIGIRIITSSTGATVHATQLDFNTNGTTDTSNVRNMKVWYTGANPKLATTNQFGSTLAMLPGTTSFSITGDQPLQNDTNYFWLTYDVDIASTIGNLIDGECTSITLGSTIQTPTITNPVGDRIIREGYCTAVVSDPNSCNYGYYISGVTTTGANSDLNNMTGCNGGVNNYIYYPDQKLTATIGQNIGMTVGDFSSYVTYSVWIDYNQDGLFSATERVLRSKTTGNYGDLEGSFIIPSTALPGLTRMRVRAGDYYWFGSYINSACNDVGNGETEDYMVEILPLPAPATYVWNQTTPADFTEATNWTPARNNSYANDKLVFNGGGSIEVNNVITQVVSKITVSNGTTVHMDGANNGTILTAGDSLQLTSGKIVGTSTVTIGVGYDTTTVGTVTGTGSVEGTVRRWINSSTVSYDFPLSNNGNNNLVNLDYTTAPVGGTITARVIPGNPGQAGLPLTDGAITINKVSPYGVWRLTSGNGYAGGVFTGTFTANGVNYVSSQADLRITRRIASIAIWSLDGTGATGTGTISSPVLSRTGMTLMGEFGVGGDVSVNALPVTLTSFTAIATKGDVMLSWKTASELNNAGFDIERSADGKTFTPVAFVKGRGNSSKPITYQQPDPGAFAQANSNILYYRLRQIDLNGNEQVSEVVSVAQSDKTVSGLVAYPNPFNGMFTIEFASTEQAVYTYSITDIQGKVLFTHSLPVTEGLNTIPVDQANLLSSGVYFLQIRGKEIRTIKLIKTN